MDSQIGCAAMAPPDDADVSVLSQNIEKQLTLSCATLPSLSSSVQVVEETSCTQQTLSSSCVSTPTPMQTPLSQTPMPVWKRPVEPFDPTPRARFDIMQPQPQAALEEKKESVSAPAVVAVSNPPPVPPEEKKRQ